VSGGDVSGGETGTISQSSNKDQNGPKENHCMKVRRLLGMKRWKLEGGGGGGAQVKLYS